MTRDDELGEDVNTVLRLGMLLLGAGTGGYRVSRAMRRTARALGCDHFDSEIGLTSIVCTATRAHHFRTVVVHSVSIGVNASRIQAIERLSRSLVPGETRESIDARLDQIAASTTNHWPIGILGLAAAIACAAFAWLNHFSLAECILVFFAAGLGQIVRVPVQRHRLNQLAVTALCAVVALVSYIAISRLCEAAHLVPIGSLDAGYVASVLFLVPGFPMFTAMVDLARFDLTAGMARAMHAIMILVSASLSMWAASQVVGIQLVNQAEIPGDFTSWFAWSILASFIGVTGFSILFNSPIPLALSAAGLGTIANAVRLALIHLDVSRQLVDMIGALIIGLLASLIGRFAQIPRICLTVPASVIMIPGTMIFRAVYLINAAQISQALPFLFQATMQILFIGGGLILARVITDRNWAFYRPLDMTFANGMKDRPHHPA